MLRHGERDSWHFFLYKYSRKGDATLPPTGNPNGARLQVMVALAQTHRAPADSLVPSSGRYPQRTERRTEALWNWSHSCGQAEGETRECLLSLQWKTTEQRSGAQLLLLFISLPFSLDRPASSSGPFFLFEENLLGRTEWRGDLCRREEMGWNLATGSSPSSPV